MSGCPVHAHETALRPATLVDAGAMAELLAELGYPLLPLEFAESFCLAGWVLTDQDNLFFSLKKALWFLFLEERLR